MVAVGAVLAVLAAMAGNAADAAPAKKKIAANQWDVVLVLTDDQPIGTLQGMPEVSRLLAARGTTFPNAIVPTSLCCPSRTSLLTGKLATATGIYSNESDTGYGGYPAVKAAGLENDTIATAPAGWTAISAAAPTTSRTASASGNSSPNIVSRR